MSADPNGSRSGEVYIMFGKESGYASSIDLLSTDTSSFLRFNGNNSNDRAGRAVSSAGDINGDGYDDIIFGANGADQAYVVFGYDTNNAQSVTNSGTSGNDQITGGAANDILSGGDGDDMINGGNGNDKITGGDGDDKLKGGHGNDEFVFNNGDDTDIILDFEDSKDKIDLSNYTKSDGSKITFNDLSISKSGGDVKITGLDSGDEILIRNISDTNITADDFIFG